MLRLMAKRPKQWGRWMATGPNLFKGGQGLLYPVEDTRGILMGEFLLKELMNLKRVERFDREIEVLQRISHPNVMDLVDAEFYAGGSAPWYVMRRADGSLADEVSRLSGNYRRIIDLAIGVAEGAAHLHANGVIHRDLKPDNILMFGNQPKISDLGLVLMMDRERLTPTWEAVGPRYYMAPELEDGRNLDVTAAADVYSLGKVIYFLLSGGDVFSREKLPPLRDRLNQAGDRRVELFEPVLRRTITDRISNRFANGGELLGALQDLKRAFEEHPRTVILDRFASLEEALRAKPAALVALTPPEQKELIEFAAGMAEAPPETFMRACIDSLNPVTIEPMTALVLRHEDELNHDAVVQAAAKIVVSSPEGGLGRWLSWNKEHRLLALALETGDIEVLNAVGSWSLLALRNAPDLLGVLARAWDNLSAESRAHFLVASFGTPYAGKEELLLRLSSGLNFSNSKLDPITLEAVIAGLASCGSDATLRRLVELDDALQGDDRIETMVRGIALGSKPETLARLVKQSWRSELLHRGIALFAEVHRSKDDEETP